MTYSKIKQIKYIFHMFTISKGTLLTKSRRIGILIGFLFFPFHMITFGQVGIGTENPNPSAILDLEADNMGVLIPRVALTGLTDNTTISEGNVESILVYNITVSSELKKGYYYWSGTQWEMLANQSYQNWNCQGNSNTNPASHFMGTTDNKELWFRTNNINRFRIGLETANSTFNTVHARFLPNTVYSGTISGISNEIDVQSGGGGGNVFGIENLMYLRSGSGVTNTFRAQRNRLWNVQTTNYPNVTGVLNEYRGEVTDITTFYGFQNTLDFRSASNTTHLFGFSNDFIGQVNGTITNYYGFYSGIHSSLGGVSNYYGFYQPNLGTNSNRFAFYYKGNATTTKDVVITGLGRVGIGVDQPHSDLQVEGSVSKKINSTNTSTGAFMLSESHYTLRIFDGISNILLPNPSSCQGRIYILIGTNGISNKNITVSGGASVYNDVSNQNVNMISANQRYQIQSDGTSWIVIGN